MSTSISKPEQNMETGNKQIKILVSTTPINYHVRSTRESNVFTSICDFTQGGGGEVYIHPVQVLSRQVLFTSYGTPPPPQSPDWD